MHEFSIASDIVKTVLDAVEKNQAKKVLTIHLEIGELTLLSSTQVAFWVKELLKGSAAEGAEVKVHSLKARIRCEACGYKGRIKGLDGADFLAHSLVPICPACGSLRVKVERGRGCVLKRIEATK